jgi:hypothetical protein
MLSLIALIGCESTVTSGRLSFTPDSNGLVFFHEEESRCGLFGMGWMLGAAAGKVELRWVSVPDDAEVLRLMVSKGVVTCLTPRPPMHVRGRMDYALISADSLHVAMLRSIGRIQIVARDGNESMLPDASSVSRFCWVSPTEVAYAETHEFQEDDDDMLTVWRQSISGKCERRMVYKAERDLWQTEWSPTGQHVVISLKDGVKVLNLRSGDVTDLGLHRRPNIRGVAWSRDGKRVFLSVWNDSLNYGPNHKDKNPGDLYHFVYLVYEPETHRRIEWRAVYPRCDGYQPGGELHNMFFPESWTAESRYLILKDPNERWLLLDPESRQTRDLSNLLAGHFRKEGIKRVYDMGALPIPGWVWVRGPAGPAENEAVFATDYDGRQFVRIANVGRNWTISADGKWIAESIGKGQVRITGVHLASACKLAAVSP